jgi:hypothetical protein
MDVKALVKNCLACNRELNGRADKKFCNDWCRNSYNNQLKLQESIHLRQINNLLRRNRRILQDLIPPGLDTAHTTRKRLLEKGFLFEYLTHTQPTRKGDVYYFCYDYGYLPLESDSYFLVHRAAHHQRE